MNDYRPEININNNMYGCCDNSVPIVPIPPNPTFMMGYTFSEFNNIGSDFEKIAEVPVTVNNSKSVRMLTINMNWIAEPEDASTGINARNLEEGFAEFLVVRRKVCTNPLTETALTMEDLELLRAAAAAPLMKPQITNLTALDPEALSAKEEAVYEIYARISEGLLKSIDSMMLMVMEVTEN